MSGGSWDYFYSQLRDVGKRLSVSPEANRRALGSLLLRCSDALHDIEWVDSSDYGHGDDAKAIAAALGKDAQVLILSEVVAQAEATLAELTVTIAKAKSVLGG
jgi:hypothetical protein